MFRRRIRRLVIQPQRKRFLWVAGCLAIGLLWLETHSRSAPAVHRVHGVNPSAPAEAAIEQDQIATCAFEPTLAAPPGARPPVIHARSAVLMDAATGRVLYALDADRELPMASTTKLMTALLFCRSVRPTDIIAVSKNAAATGGSSLHLRPGEMLNACDLLHGILMRSANDACVAAAEHIAGTEQAFVRRMNATALELGAPQTHYANSHGLTAPGHYTTARDLAIIASAAMREPRIRAIVRTQYYQITRSSRSKDVELRNHSHFLGAYPGADGVKTGWTVPAGHCFVGSATHNGWELISVVLHSPNYVAETRDLMSYGFEHFAPRVVVANHVQIGSCPVQGGVDADVPVGPDRPLEVVAPLGQPVVATEPLHLNPAHAPIDAGEILGRVDAIENGYRVASAPAVALMPDPASRAAFVQSVLGATQGEHALAALLVCALGVVTVRYAGRSRWRTRATQQDAGSRRRSRAPKLR